MPTLLQYYHDFLRGRNRAHQGAEDLLRLYFSDSNVQAIEDAIHARLGQLIGDLRDAREATTVQNSIQLRDALFQVAFERGHQPANPEILLDMNRRAVERAVNALSAELVYQARFERFRKHGARPTDISRPESDRERGDVRESKAPIFGMGFRSNPFEAAFGGAVRSYDQFWNLVGNNRAEGGRTLLSHRTGSDAIRIQVIPGMPVYRRHEEGTTAARRPFVDGRLAPGPCPEASAALSNPQATMGYSGVYNP